MSDASADLPVDRLTPTAERWIRGGAIIAALIIAISATILSYSGLHDLALDAQVHPRLALLVPVMVDGLQFVGSLGVVYSTLTGVSTGYPWALMLGGVTISAWGNWQAAPDDLTAKLVHASSPVILALVLEELLRTMRHTVVRAQAARAALARVAVAEPAPTTVAAVTTSASPPEVPKPRLIQPTPVAEPPQTPPVTGDRPSPAPEVVRPPSADTKPSAPIAASPVARPTAPTPSTTRTAQSPGIEGIWASLDDRMPLKEKIVALLRADPTITPPAVYGRLGTDPSHTRKTFKQAAAQVANETQPAPAPASEPAPVIASTRGQASSAHDEDAPTPEPSTSPAVLQPSVVRDSLDVPRHRQGTEAALDPFAVRRPTPAPASASTAPPPSLEPPSSSEADVFAEPRPQDRVSAAS